MEEKWINILKGKIPEFHKKSSPGKRIMLTLDESNEFINDLESLSKTIHAKRVSDEDIEKLAYERHPERILPEWGGAKPMDLNLEKRELFKRDAKWMQDRLPQQTEGKEYEFSCRECGSEMNEGEAKTFTCCDKCWDKHYIKPEAS